MDAYHNPQDYDDLDIEGKDVAEKKKHKEQDKEEKELLSIKVPTTDNSYGYVFSVRTDGDTRRWRCHLCDIVVVGQAHVGTHIQTKKHQVRMTMPVHPASLFTRFHNKVEQEESPVVNPGQPAPPGCEDSLHSVTQLQATLDHHNSSPLIGLEYVVEIVPDEEGKEPTYVCMLCDKKGDPRVVMAHLSSFNHCSKYISIHFPTVNRRMNKDIPRSKEGRKAAADVVHKLCATIEETYGRLRPVPVTRAMFENNKSALIKQLVASRHLVETPDCTFEDIINESVLGQFVDIADVPVPDGPGGPTSAGQNQDSSKDDDKHSGKDSPVSSQDNTSNDSICRKSTMNRSRMKMRDEDKLEEIKLKFADKDSKKEVIVIKDTSSISSSESSRSRSRSPRSKPDARFRGSVYGRNNYRDRYRRHRSRSRSPSRSRSRRSRSRSPRSRRHRGSRPLSPRETERAKWEKYRQRVDAVERELNKEMQFHGKNPEKHPAYPDEWKKFWNRRYKELQAEGKDPTKHDFKPEWIEFWNKRMQEMHKQELREKKEEIRQVLGLPRDAGDGPRWLWRPGGHVDRSPSPAQEKRDVTVADIKNTWKALTGSDIKDSGRQRSPSPWEESRGRSHRRVSSGGFGRQQLPETVRVVTVLRLLIAMENQLGSLGPRVNDLMTAALSLEKVSQNSSDTLLLNADHLVLFETVAEKFKGQLLAGIVERHMVGPTRRCLDYLSELLARANTFPQAARQERLSHSQVGVTPVMQPAKYVPSASPYVSGVAAPAVRASQQAVPVPGVGTVDRVAIAQQIAAALVAQGKTDVTEDQLEQLIAAVVGMAQAQAATGNQTISTAQYLQQLQQGPGDKPQPAAVTTASPAPVPAVAAAPAPVPVAVPTSVPVVARAPTPPPTKPAVSALQLLQSAYNDAHGVRARSPVPRDDTAGDAMAELSDAELQTLLHNFKNLLTDEQHQLISYLKKLEAVEPDKVERLRKFVNLGPSSAGEDASLAPSSVPAPAPAVAPAPAYHIAGGRLSPFSMREAGINPSQEDRRLPPSEPVAADDVDNSDEDDDDYSYEDIYAAASKKVQEKEQEELRKKMEEEERKRKLQEEEEKKRMEEEEEKRKKLEGERRLEEEKKRKLEQERSLENEKKRKLEAEARFKDPEDDPGAVLRKTNAMIANIMEELPAKFGTRTSSPVVGAVPFQQQWGAGGPPQDAPQPADYGRARSDEYGGQQGSVSSNLTELTSSAGREMPYGSRDVPPSANPGTREIPRGSGMQYGSREMPMPANLADRGMPYGGREMPLSANLADREMPYGGREMPLSANLADREMQYGGREMPLSANLGDRDNQYSGREMPLSANHSGREMQYGDPDMQSSANLADRDMQYGGREMPLSANLADREMQYSSREMPMSANLSGREMQYSSRDMPMSASLAGREMQYGDRDVQYGSREVRGGNEMHYGGRDMQTGTNRGGRESQGASRGMYQDRGDQGNPAQSTGGDPQQGAPYNSQYGGSYQGYSYGGGSNSSGHSSGYYPQYQSNPAGVPPYQSQPNYHQVRPTNPYSQQYRQYY